MTTCSDYFLKIKQPVRFKVVAAGVVPIRGHLWIN